MTVTRTMLESSPADSDVSLDALAHCIDMCHECAEACSSCADACLAEEMVAEMRRCITLNLNCADLCVATANVLTRHAQSDTSLMRATLEGCIEACRLCAAECASHEHMEHCALCAEACQRCLSACEHLLVSL